MERGRFSSVAMQPEHANWHHCIDRKLKLYAKREDIRSEFNRDYNRILHSKAYRRLKHKTQVFMATGNDHVCTRIEHVNHVAAVSYSIANFLGLNHELTSAIALGHDIGHAPFGHDGEAALRKIAKDKFGETFWHEKNSLHFADNLETLPDLYGRQKNLTLTYAVRDGIISHCGEINENAISPREENIDLEKIERPNQYAPYTWEACVVKIADKISYLGRDIEDALTLKILTRQQLKELKDILDKSVKVRLRAINNTALMHNFISNLCDISDPVHGIRFSDEYLYLINAIKDFNYRNIYLHPRLDYFLAHSELIINSIFNALDKMYEPNNQLKEFSKYENIYPSLIGSFSYWIVKYSDLDLSMRKMKKFENHYVYIPSDRLQYQKAIIDYISSMTDHFAINVFNELTKF